jgi:hypothetical protein
MPKFIKHVGQVSDSGKKCVVIFRSIPGEENSCLVIETEGLSSQYHDNLLEAVESTSGQEDVDFFKYAQRSTFFDGRNMLEAMHLSGWLKKYPTSNVIMTPTREISIGLNELNVQLGQNDDTGRTTSSSINASEGKPAGVLDDKDLANQMRSQAAFFKGEADRLLREAEALHPSTLTTSNITPAEPEKRGRGRPRKTV